jgi:hypothetical protein
MFHYRKLMQYLLFVTTNYWPQTHTDSHRHIYPHVLLAVCMLNLIDTKIKIHLQSGVLAVAIKI